MYVTDLGFYNNALNRGIRVWLAQSLDFSVVRTQALICLFSEAMESSPTLIHSLHSRAYFTKSDIGVATIEVHFVTIYAFYAVDMVANAFFQTCRLVLFGSLNPINCFS